MVRLSVAAEERHLPYERVMPTAPERSDMLCDGAALPLLFIRYTWLWAAAHVGGAMLLEKRMATSC